MLFGLFKKNLACFSQLGITTDWHCHLLSGVDDGVQDADQSAQILSDMRKAGITRVVHTPHFNSEIFPENTEKSIKTKFEKYLKTLPSESLEGMDIRLAGEYMVTNGFENRNMKELLQFDEGKVLIEMSYMYPSATIEETVFNITMAGLVPVIAHPERYLYYSEKLGQYDRLRDMGAEFQLNLLSLEGCYGFQSVRIMEYLLKNGWYSYVGTDTHTLHHFQHISDFKFKADYVTMVKQSVGEKL